MKKYIAEMLGTMVLVLMVVGQFHRGIFISSADEQG